MIFDQSEYDIRCEWGQRGVLALAPTSDVVIIVDILSFSTSVSIATERGAAVFPYHGLNESLAEYAAQRSAVPIGFQRDKPGYTLSPSSLLAVSEGHRLVLPSPNGSTLTAVAAETGPPAHILAGCLRNTGAVAAVAASLGRRIAVIPAGERWRVDGSLRPSAEDILGAGAIISQLPGARSPEAEVAAASFEGMRSRLVDVVSRCGSGRELIERGFSADVALATEFNVSDNAPRLIDGAYRRFRQSPAPSAG